MIEKIPLLAGAARALSVAMVERAQSGHLGLPLGAADVATVLFTRHLHCSPLHADNISRDRFVLSAGHGSALLYSLLHLLQYKSFDLPVLQKFRSLHAAAAGHPEYHMVDGKPLAGIETTTGPLGQGLANAVGMAVGLKKIFAATPAATPRVYVMLGDGCLMEGISEEALSLAGHLQLENLILLFDDNHISIDGDINLTTRTDHEARCRAHGFHTLSVDGHDPVAIDKAIAEARGSDRPSFIACRTIIGKGAPTSAGTAAAHGMALGKGEAVGLLAKLGIPDPEKFLKDFILPSAWLDVWNDVAKQKINNYQDKAKNLAAGVVPQHDIDVMKDSPNNKELLTEIQNYKTNIVKENKPLATRVASQQALEIFSKHVPGLVGGSADLGGSNGTKIKGQQIINKDNPAGSYLHYGVREHGMAAVMNGLALVGFIPYGGTFLVFSDYCRAALRLSALMKQKVIYVFTHDSIGVGEDGPTHQPVEHLAALRAIPHLLVLRPCDAIETVEAWQIALSRQQPTVLALSRQNLPLLRQAANPAAQNKTAAGGYVIYGQETGRDITLLASGSEVSLAVAAAQDLEKMGKQVAVVSLPCFELFRQLPLAERQRILGDAPRVGIEAAVRQPWHEWLRAATMGNKGDEFIGLDDFGASAPYQDIYNERGICKENILKVALKLL